jgi:hypothetical protein
MKMFLPSSAAALLVSLAFAASTPAQAEMVVVGGCGPQGRSCEVTCPKRGDKQLLLAVAVCNNHGKPGASAPEYGVGGEVMPSYTSGHSAKCTAGQHGFGDSMYGVCVSPN